VTLRRPQPSRGGSPARAVGPSCAGEGADGGDGERRAGPVRIADLLWEGRPPRPWMLLLLVGFDCQAVRKTRKALSVCTPCLCTVLAERQWTKGSRPPRRRGGNAVGSRRSTGGVEPSRWTSGRGTQAVDLGVTVDSNTARQAARGWCERGPPLRSHPNAAVEGGDGSAGSR